MTLLRTEHGQQICTLRGHTRGGHPNVVRPHRAREQRICLGFAEVVHHRCVTLKLVLVAVGIDDRHGPTGAGRDAPRSHGHAAELLSGQGRGHWQNLGDTVGEVDADGHWRARCGGLPLHHAGRELPGLPAIGHEQLGLAVAFVLLVRVGGHMTEQIWVQLCRRRKAAETERQQHPATLLIDVVRVEPSLVDDHDKDLVLEVLAVQTPLHNVGGNHPLTRGRNGRVAHKLQDRIEEQ